jgi:cell division protease FtsH
MSKEPKAPADDGQKNTRRPRGMGGVILILALLMALFLVVSRQGLDSQNSVHAFYSHLLNGRVEKLTLADGVATAEVRLGERQKRSLEVVVRDFLRDEQQQEIQFYNSLAALRLDTGAYPADQPDSLERFVQDLEARRIRVLAAYFVNEIETKTPQDRQREDHDQRQAGCYVTALLQRETAVQYVRLDARSQSTKSLLQVTEALRAANVPVRNFNLSLGANEFRITEPNTALIYVLGTAAPWILILAIVWFFFLRQMRAPGGAGGVLSFGRSRAALYTKENRTNITFDDVAGMEEAKSEVREIIEFLKNPAKFARLGGSIPRGVLLVGSPGTGKTLLAKAIAGEAEVPFFSISGSDFVEMFVGVGASRVRDLFKQAREASPCIVFLDEIDAVGRKRGTGMGGGHDEREQTLNAILVEMDGFDSDKGIILVGATNRPDVLDPALLRPGRFDRQVVIDLPDVKGREAILKVHARKIKLGAAVDLQTIAKATAGFSGAELAAVINEAAILAAMKNKEAVDHGDLEEARDRVRWGREKRSRAIEEEDRKVTAYHEAGHALVSCMTPDQDPVHKVTIVSRGRALGATLSLPEKDDYNHWRKKLLGRIAVCFGGRAAEEIVFGDVSAGAQNDIEQATNLAKVMVCELGMSPRTGPIKYTSDDQNPFLGREFHLANDLSEKTLELINEETRRLIDDQYAAARRLLLENRPGLDRLAQALLRHETLTGDEVAAVLRGDDLEEFRAAQIRQQQNAERAPRRTEISTEPGAAAEPRVEPGNPGVGLSGA